MLIRLFFIFFLFVLFQQSTKGQEQVVLDFTDHFSIYSDHVQDTFHIQISLPFDYYNSEQQYPVVFLLDSDRMFGMTHDIVHWLYFSKEIPEVITVGIAYKKNWWHKRARDYTPTIDHSKSWGEWPMSAGADNFMLFIKNELTASLKDYRIDDTDRTIIGLSLGGTFCNYVLFSEPIFFTRYLMVSPALLWNYEYILKMDIPNLDSDFPQKVKVFTAMGALDHPEKLIIPWNNMNEMISEKKYQNLIWKNRMYDNQSHISVLPAALTDGLKFLLND
jgi:predicted alpha/beta superfamily hydrolase